MFWRSDMSAGLYVNLSADLYCIYSKFTLQSKTDKTDKSKADKTLLTDFFIIIIFFPTDLLKISRFKIQLQNLKSSRQPALPGLQQGNKSNQL